MSGVSIADNGISSFHDYTAETSPEELVRHLGYEPACLADFIKAWVQSGEGVRACIGDFQTFLITVIAVIDEWRTDPVLLDYVTDDSHIIERRPTTIFGERDLAHDILDPHFFATRKFRVLER
jgi:hypothetical protein